MAGSDLRTAGNPAEPTALPTGRATELLLLAFAAAIVTGALVLVEINASGYTDPGRSITSLLWVGAAYLGLFSAGHFAVRQWAPYADPLVLPCVALLNGLGLVMIYRLDIAGRERAARLGTELPAELIARQVAWTAVGLALFVAVLYLAQGHRGLARFAYAAGFAGLVLLALPGLLPDAISEINGAKIWLRVGALSIQPGEFAKILMIVFFAAFLVQKADLFKTAGKRFLGMELPRARDLAPLLLAWGVSVGVLVVERDLGTSLLFFGIVLVMIYVATERVSWMVIGLSFFVSGALVAYSLFGHVQRRVEVWMDPFSDYDRAGYQIAQALFGLGTGGVGGTGLGAGRPDLVPFAATDFILSSLGEELGLIGLAAILVVYLVLITRGLRSAVAVRDSFGTLLATGLAFTIALQIFVVIGGASKLIPLTGLTLPFLSYGGSSLVANYALVALLLRVSNAARAPLPSRPPPARAPIAEAGTQIVERPA